MFHIVGTNHDLQHDGEPRETSRPEAEKARAELRAYLHKLADATHPMLIAEELSLWYLKHCKNGANSIAKEVADSRCGLLRIPKGHRFCDPGLPRRQRLGLATFNHDDCTPDLLRECYWLACLLDVLRSDVLFVCGATHVKSFSGLLRNRGIKSTVHAKYFREDLFQRPQCDPQERI